MVDALLRHPKFERRPEMLAKAKRSRDSLLREHPEQLVSHLVDGNVHLLDGKHQKALQAAERALAIAPDNPGGHQLRGLAQKGLGQIRNAGDSFVTAGKLDPTSSSSGDMLAGLGKAAAPIGFALYALVRISATAGASAGWLIGIVILLAGGAFLYWRRQETKPEELSPEAKRVLETRKKMNGLQG